MAEESLKHKTKKGIYWTFFNQFANNGLQFVVGIIMARILSPSDYGITALPVVFMSVAEVFINGGFGTAMVRKPELTDHDLSTAFMYSASVGVLCYILIFFGAPFIADFYETPVLTPLIRVTALSFLWSPLATPQNIILQRRLDFKTPARIAITTKIFGAIIGIIFAYLGYGLWSLVIMGTISSLLSLLQTWLSVRWTPSFKWSRTSFRYLWGFGNKLMASALLDKIYCNIVPVFVGKFYSPAQLGVYNRAQGYAALPSQQGTSVIQQVTFPVLSKMQDDDDMLAANYRRMIRTAAFVIFPVMMLLSALARPLIIVMVTDKWEGAIILLQLICFSSMWYPIHAMNLNLLQVKGRSDLFLRLEIIKKIMGVSILAITLPISLVAVVLGGWVSNVLSLVINTFYTGKLIGVNFLKQMGDLLPIFAISVAMWGIVFGITFLIPNYYLQILVGAIVGVLFYFATARILKRPEMADLKYMLRRK